MRPGSQRSTLQCKACGHARGVEYPTGCGSWLAQNPRLGVRSRQPERSRQVMRIESSGRRIVASAVCTASSVDRLRRNVAPTAASMIQPEFTRRLEDVSPRQKLRSPEKSLRSSQAGYLNHNREMV